MNSFLKKSLLFSLPILLVAISFELLLRRIPNDYQYKKDYLDKNSKSIQTLFLGSSHSYFGINPEFTQSKSFNASYMSQSYKYDLKILKKYDGKWDSLKCIAIPVSYFSLFWNLETGIESWRTKNYMIYYGFNCSANVKDYSEFLSNTFKVNFLKLYSFYWVKQNTINCTDLGFGLDYNSKYKKELIKSAAERAKVHTAKDFEFFNQNKEYLTQIVQFAKARNIKIVLYTPPAYSTYVEKLDKKQLDYTIQTAEELQKNYKNVTYLNFMTDKRFQENDFYDVDHLNEIGAKKLTLLVDSCQLPVDRNKLSKVN